MDLLRQILVGITAGIVVGLVGGGIILVYAKGMNYILCRVFRLSEKKAKWVTGVLAWVLFAGLWYWYHKYYRPQQS